MTKPTVGKTKSHKYLPSMTPKSLVERSMDFSSFKCEYCSRKFAKKAIDNHKKICKKKYEEQQLKRRLDSKNVVTTAQER